MKYQVIKQLKAKEAMPIEHGCRVLEASRSWVSDITDIRTRSGWLYRAGVLDLHSRKRVGWAMAPNMPAELVCTALQMAICQRAPAPGLVVHSDRGSQYASEEHRKRLVKHGLLGSMSRKGHCWDNSVMERFFLNLKMERVWPRNYANHQEAINDITDYIVNFYNSKRLHSTLGYLPPNAFEQQLTDRQPIVRSKILDQYSLRQPGFVLSPLRCTTPHYTKRFLHK